MNESRRNLLGQFRDFKVLTGLEIGALTSPLITQADLTNEGKIFYLDHLSTQDLKKKYKDDKSVEIAKIVDVDFVCPEGNILEAVGDKKFDYVIASHVIEHAPNFISFLSNIFDVLKPGGLAFLVVPDKRFTFDFYRPETSFGTLLEAYLAELSRPPISAVYDHFASAVKVDAQHIWRGEIDTSKLPTLTPLSVAWKSAELAQKNGKYLDVHVNIFTPFSFFEILKKTIIHGILSFEVQGFSDTAPGELDFVVALKKMEGDLGIKMGSEFLKTFPKLELETHLSPYMPQVKQLSKALEKITETASKHQTELESLRVKSTLDADLIKSFEAQLQVAQRVLDRRSVKLVLSIIHRLKSFGRPN